AGAKPSKTSVSLDAKTVTLRGPGLTEDQVVAVARHAENVALAASARLKMELSRARVERAASSRDPVYGVSTGFGALAGTRVAPPRQPELQLALIRSHAAGVGPPVDTEVVRATMLLRARTLARGMSGVRPVLADALIAMLNAGITPVVPRYGSVGCSGDLAPVAHIGLALVGEGHVAYAEGALQPAGGGGRARHARLRPPHRRGGAVIGHRQPDRSRERRCGVERELPRRAARLRRGFSGHRRRRGWLDRRAPRRPPARSAPLPGSAALPRRRAWRELRADGCPVHGRGAGRGKPPACRARKRRLG